MYNLEITRFIDAAHQLPDSDSLTTKKCMNLHGHTYCIKVKIVKMSPRLEDGMVVDFGRIKDSIDILDHVFINDIFAQSAIWKDEPTTAENIAKFLSRHVESWLGPDYAISISVCEGYKGPESSNWVHYE